MLYDIILLIIQTGYIDPICCSLCSCSANRKEEQKDGEVDERFWELLLSADKKDYERICAEYGVTDFRWMLKKLNEKKKELEEQQAQVKWQASYLNVFCLYLPWDKEIFFKLKISAKFSETLVFFSFRNLNLLFLQQYIEYLSNLRHIEIKNSGCAQFEFEMDLRDPNAKIFLYKVRLWSKMKLADILISHLDKQTLKV